MIKIFDIATSEFREITQEDVDSLARVQAAFGELRMGMRALLDVTIEMARGERPLTDIAEKIRSSK